MMSLIYDCEGCFMRGLENNCIKETKEKFGCTENVYLPDLNREQIDARFATGSYTHQDTPCGADDFYKSKQEYIEKNYGGKNPSSSYA